MNRNFNLYAGLAISALLGLVDVVGLAGVGTDDAPPLIVFVVAAVLGVATLAAVRPALHRVRVALLTVICSRALSALWGLPVYFVDGAPGWAKTATTISIALTAVGIALLTPVLRRHPAASLA